MLIDLPEFCSPNASKCLARRAADNQVNFTSRIFGSGPDLFDKFNGIALGNISGLGMSPHRVRAVSGMKVQGMRPGGGRVEFNGTEHLATSELRSKGYTSAACKQINHPRLIAGTNAIQLPADRVFVRAVFSFGHWEAFGRLASLLMLERDNWGVARRIRERRQRIPDRPRNWRPMVSLRLRPLATLVHLVDDPRLLVRAGVVGAFAVPGIAVAAVLVR
jgi:hypothetical protein